mmetsp:Transcript_19319/g.23194  ORF Transcript_19319/g.23194 Transcript_19319/m.23194 type:complete len:207 (+) Transcript_19319:128-748(+)|eukprot:CAMPEP_0195301062 /NCGR_PEP_ID=MMETSP0707-20130614/28680_1 /TAXON_ID=33640 /ORGANISM="Asterionellopsis glacialis, Strain CCMP134" /LENGTH=206 /DNA_ID=CAMNT_0040363917 /DNA_START=70 /DNA_END=690 /DNA_ORIENTATION=-
MSLSAPSNDNGNGKVLVDYHTTDYRGFAFVRHVTHGLLLLHCTRKPQKGHHFQLPGGHIDEAEFLLAAQSRNFCEESQLLHATRAGTARELYEETGMDVRDTPERLEPLILRSIEECNDKHKYPFAMKSKMFFRLNVNDEDFITQSGGGLVGPMGSDGTHLRLRLSVEHSGYKFEKDLEKASDMLEKHSGGAGSKALRKAIELGSL